VYSIKNRWGWFSLISFVLFVIFFVISFSFKIPGMAGAPEIVAGNVFAILGIISLGLSAILGITSLVKKENKWVAIPVLAIIFLLILAVLILSIYQ